MPYSERPEAMTKTNKSSNPRTVLIVDDHELMRKALEQLINEEPDLAACGQAEDAIGALRAIDRLKPDIALVDISLKESHGIELIKDIKARWPDLPVLVLSMHEESFYAERALRAGAKGYVNKAEVSSRVIEGLRKVLAGEIYVTDEMASRMLIKFVGPKGDSIFFSIDALSDREFQVFELIGQGLQSREIARQLHLSVKTVDTHREHIKKKLNLETSTELPMYAIQWAQFEREQ
jgi:DNA-binding NarL/FixJ family response regulator